MRKILWVIVACVLLAGAWYYYSSNGSTDSSGQAGTSGAHGGGKKGGGKNAAVPVSVATATTKDIPVFLQGLGNITPLATVTVHTLVNGELMQVLYNEGQIVQKDQLLATIDDRPYAAVLLQAQGFLTRDQALLAEAKIDLARYQTLWKQDSIAKQQLDTQTSLVKQYEGTVENDQGQVDAAKTNLIYTKITSPVTGRVGLRLVDPGNIVHTSDTNGIVVVTQLQPITAIFSLPEDYIPEVMKHMNDGEKLVTEAWDRDNKNKLATGTLLAVDNVVNTTTGTVNYRAQFDNEDNALFPSQFVNIRLQLRTLKGAVAIPSAGVQRGANGTFVYLVKDKDGAKIVSVQPITAGPADGDSVSITNGLSVGDQVVVDGADGLRDGSKIEIAAVDGKAAGKKAAGGDKGDGTKSGQGDDQGEKKHKHKKHNNDVSQQQ